MTGHDGNGVDEAVADIVDTRENVIEAVVRFVRALRGAGVAVPADGVIAATEALAALGFDDEETVRAATKASLLSRERDVEPFERLFGRFWYELRTASRETAATDEPAPDDQFGADELQDPGTDSHDEYDRSDGDRGEPDELELEGTTTRVGGDHNQAQSSGDTVEVARYSPAGQSESVERTSWVDRHGLDAAVSRLTRALATIPGRRRRRARQGEYVDARRALRASFQTGGVVASLPRSEPVESAVRGVVLVDVSQSVLDSVDREFLLEWLRLLSSEWRSCRVFFFDTDLREVTDAFDERTVGDVSGALARAEAAWGGGTRIGHALETVRQSYPDAVDHRTVVLVVSDGLERGEVDELEGGVAWLSRRAGLVLWLNPLASSSSYEPTARGMAAALPALDGLFAFSGPGDVAELARQLDRHDRTRLGYEYDPRRADEPVGDDDGFRTDSTLDDVRPTST